MTAVGSAGSFVVPRSDRPLVEAGAVAAAGGEPCWSARDGGWRILQILGGDDVDGRRLGAETGAPTLVASVVDGDFAVVEGRSPSAGRWSAVLSPETAGEYGCPDHLLVDPEVSAAHAVRWAEEAGLRPDPSAVAAASTAEGDPFAEDLLISSPPPWA
ncbi:hypothetical protein GCM10025734_78710 [Kitasatospora paranensis]